MDIKIIETGAIEELSIIDPKSGVDWINDLMGNHDCLPEIDDDGYGLMSQAEYDWWRNLTTEYQAADYRYHDLLSNLDEDASARLFEDANHINTDLEGYPCALQMICDDYDNA